MARNFYALVQSLVPISVFLPFVPPISPGIQDTCSHKCSRLFRPPPCEQLRSYVLLRNTQHLHLSACTCIQIYVHANICAHVNTKVKIFSSILIFVVKIFSQAVCVYKNNLTQNINTRKIFSSKYSQFTVVRDAMKSQALTLKSNKIKICYSTGHNEEPSSDPKSDTQA